MSKHLRSCEASSTTVLEIDTHLNRHLYPNIKKWLDYTDVISKEQATDIDRKADDILDEFLSAELSQEGIPTHRSFRTACLTTDARRLVIAYLISLQTALNTLESSAFERIIVTAGSGIHFAAWQEAASTQSLPISFIYPESRSLDLHRLLKKGCRKFTQFFKVKTPQLRHAVATAKTSLNESILCTSERLVRLLSEDSSISGLPFAPLPELGSRKDVKKIRSNQQLFLHWWKNWQQKFLPEKVLIQTYGFRNILNALGTQAVHKVYPRYAWVYNEALKYLQQHRPRILLCDTQVGTPERMWSLAAQELKIPVIAYVYDQLPNPRFSFKPDFVLSDSGRTTLVSLKRGIPQETLLNIRSHRQARLPVPQQPALRPLAVYADSYYVGTTSVTAPNFSYRYYHIVVEAAKKLPEHDFIIKFHPLRGKKQADLGFVAFDETELALRKRYIRALCPPANLRLMDPESNLIQLLRKTSVLLNYNSTAALESFEMEVPVIFLKAPEREVPTYLRIHDFNACIVAENTEAVVTKIEELRTHKDMRDTHILNQKRYLQEVYWPTGLSLGDGLRTCLSRLS